MKVSVLLNSVLSGYVICRSV